MFFVCVFSFVSTKSWCGALARNEGRDTEAVSDVELSWLKQQTEP